MITRLIYGANSPIASQLSQLIVQKNPNDKLITISRGNLNVSSNVHTHFIVDGSTEVPFEELISKNSNAIGLVNTLIFFPSEWGNDSKLTNDRLLDFLDTGPKKFLDAINSLMKNELINDESILISIGSIAEAHRFSTDNISYSIAKSMQKNICDKLIGSEGLKLSHITCGSIANNGVNVGDFLNTINYLENSSKNAFIPNIEIYGKCDIKK